MKTSQKLGEFRDFEINVKQKIAALWIGVMFLYVYVDIFTLFKPGVIEGIVRGEVFVFKVSQLFLFLTTLYVAIPILMIFLSLLMRPKVNRAANIVVSIVYLITMIGACVGESWAFYYFGTLVESVLLLLIVYFAWRWPTHE